MVHADNQGLVLPPRVAPTQVFFPCFYHLTCESFMQQF